MSLGIYKRGQGKYTRLGSGLAGALLSAIGCYVLYTTQLKGTELNLWVQILSPVGLFAVLCLLIFWLMNRASVADFMISAEGEMKKVSWSSRKEITDSTIIVIVVVFLLAVLIGLTDLIFQLFFGHVLHL